MRTDAAAVTALLHPEYLEFGTSGRVWTRRAVAETIASDPEPIVASDLKAHRLSTDIVLVTYRAERLGRATLRSSIWVHDRSGWKMRFHQGTALD